MKAGLILIVGLLVALVANSRAALISSQAVVEYTFQVTVPITNASSYFRLQQ